MKLFPYLGENNKKDTNIALFLFEGG